MSNLKIFSAKLVIFVTITAIFFQLLVLLYDLVNNVPKSISMSVFTPIPTSQLDYNLSLPNLSTDLASPTNEPPNDELGSVIMTSDIVINAVNPGYNTESGKNSGELIELKNLSDEEISLDNIAIIYTAKPTSASPNGKSTILYQFPVGSKFIGKAILLRYELSPEATDGNQDLTYSTSIAMAGSLALVRLNDIPNLEALISTTSDLSNFGEVGSSVCWLGGEDCLQTFSTTVKSRSYTTIARNPDSGEYEHVTEYISNYDAAFPGLYLPPEETATAEGPTSDMFAVKPSTKATSTDVFDFAKDAQCQGLIFSEILSYYDENAEEQFIEFYNSTNSTIEIGGCKVRYKNKFYDLLPKDSNEHIVAASDYYVLHPEFKMTKNPNTESTIELYDINGTLLDALVYPHGQKKTASYALINYNGDGTANWQITYAITPGESNVYQQYKTCPAGKVINETTGNCVKAATISSAIADCPAGKYRNPTTGRCKNIEDNTSSSECKEGYEKNPETGRCRKIKDNKGAKYPVVPTTGVVEQSVFIGLLAILGVVIAGSIYVIFQFRHEIAHFFRKILTKNK